MPKLEILAQELETVAAGKGCDWRGLVFRVRDDHYSRDALIEELKAMKLKFFADKLASRYYDNHQEKDG